MENKVATEAAAPDEKSAVELLRKKTFNRNKWFYSVSGIGRDMSYALIDSFLLIYIQFGVSLTLAQFTTLSLIIGVGGRIWDAMNDPLMGAIIEGSHFKNGKFRPWILLGAILCGLAIIVMFNVQSIPGWRFVVFMTIMYLLWESTFTMNDIGYWAMLPSLSSVKEERNSITTLTVLFAGVGAILAQGIIPQVTVGDMRAGYRFVSILIAAAFIGCQLLLFFTVKEPPRRKVENSENISLKKMWKTIARNDQVLWMTLSMLFYNIGSTMLIALAANLLYMEIGYNGTLYFYVVVAYGVTMVAVNALYPALVNKLGRNRLQNTSILTAVIGYALIALMGWTSILPFNIALLCAFCMMVSAGQSLFYMSCIINMANCVEYNDYKYGERNEAVVSTLRPFMAKFAAAMHTLIVTLVLAISGTFLLSQSISTLETQRDFFDKHNPADQAYYITQVQDYLKEYDGLKAGTPEYKAAAQAVGTRIAADDVVSKFQLDPEYVPALSDAMVIVTDAQGNAKEISRLGAFDANMISATNGTFSIKIDDLKSGDESAANIHFRDQRTMTMRVWVRLAATLLPALMLVISLWIQKKKFIIDENFYDQMMVEINNRKEEENSLA
ncbi:MAG TPA: glycoside-pentoside-hexuronide (GPH):cation symporter [Clostridia bacterium]|nr:glycoside-pentoside-hexuronide (GPH):cation symporter [Clostridia bacterium]